jgi:anti-sigma regulatory factor (Ser/Thr protein kinase)
MADIDVRLAADIGAPEAARRSIEELRSTIDPATLDEAVLLVSELVTNSVRHACLDEDQSIGVRAVVGQGAVRVEVSDPGRGFDADVVPRPAGGGGWGLWLLDRIASAWGVHPGEPTTVWFELGFRPAQQG